MRRLCAAALSAAMVFGSACFDEGLVGPNPGDDVRITYVGTAITDSAGAVVDGVRFKVTEAGSEDRPYLGLTAIFIPEGEECGEALTPSGRTDEEGEVETRWQLGDQAGRCVLRTRVVNAGGLLLDLVDIEAEVLHGQATLLEWITEGESIAANGVLAVTGGASKAFDRLSNDVAWRFRVIEGPVRTVGSDFDSEGARTLVPSGGMGAGQVVVESRWGEIVTLDLCVSPGTPAAEIRLHWTAPGESPPACG